jgi:membrane fusion protein, multidrug efflux system
MFRIEVRYMPLWARTPYLTAGGLGLVLVAALGGCSRTQGLAAPAPPAPPIEVQVAHLTRGSVTRSITLPAQVLPEQQATLYAKASGYLQSIRVDKGDHVKAGALLAQVEVPELQASRAKQQAELRTAEAEYGRLQESLQRAPDLVVPQMVDQARGRMDIARASLDQSETMLRYATLTAPFGGVITQRLVDPGALIQAGTPIVTLMDFSKVRLQVAVPELEASRVAVGQPVSVSTDNLPGAQFEGKVARFSYALDTASRTMLAEVSLENKGLQLRPGMLVTAKLGIERREDAALIPVDALVMEKTNAFVYVIAGDTVAKRPIKVGFNDGRNAEVLEGARPGEAIARVGKRSLTDGQVVRVAAAE